MPSTSWQDPPILFLLACIARQCEGDSPPRISLASKKSLCSYIKHAFNWFLFTYQSYQQVFPPITLSLLGEAYQHRLGREQGLQEICSIDAQGP